MKHVCSKHEVFCFCAGLKPGQRKVLFTCFKRNDKREVKVAQLAGSVAEMSSYHHGEVGAHSHCVKNALKKKKEEIFQFHEIGRSAHLTSSSQERVSLRKRNEKNLLYL